MQVEIIYVDLKPDANAVYRDFSKVMFAVRIIVWGEGLKALNSRHQLVEGSILQGSNALRGDNGAACKGCAKAVIQLAAKFGLLVLCIQIFGVCVGSVGGAYNKKG